MKAEALVSIVVTFGFGYVVGWLLGALWNWLDIAPTVRTGHRGLEPKFPQ